MKLTNCKVTILFSEDGLTIELDDSDAVVRLARIILNQKQTCQALSRLGYTPCEVEVWSLDKVGKKRLTEPFTFPMPDCSYKESKDVASREAVRLCPEGWEPSTYFGSQDSFFKRDNETWARTVIHKWVDKED